MAFSFGAPSSSATTQPSLFGSSTSTPKPLFGNAASSTPSAGGGLFGGGNAAASATATPSLFGAVKPATNLFGSTPASQPAASTPAAPPTLTLTPADAAKPTSLFGGNQTSAPPMTGQSTTPAPSTGFSLFGAAKSSAAPAGTVPGIAVTPPTQLFGAAPAASSAAPSMFNQSAAPAATQQPAAGGLFGQAAAKPATGGLFGGGLGSSNPAQQGSTGSAAPALGGSLFGGANANANASTTKLSTNQPAPLFSSLGSAAPAPTILQPVQQQPQVVPGVKIDVSNIKPTTRFFELHDGLQKQIEMIDNFVQTQISLFAQCEAFIPTHGLTLKTIPGDVDFIQKKFETVTSALDRDASEISAVKEAVQSDITDARRVFGATEMLKLPAQFQYSLGYANADSSSNDSDNNAFAQNDLAPYFEEQIKEVDRRLQTYNQQLSEIESHLRTVDSSATEQAHKLLRRQAGEDGSRERVQELGNAMRIFEDAVLRVASKVGEAREGVIECTMGHTTVNGNGRSTRRR